MLDIFGELGPATLLIVGLAAIATAAIHGATGIAGGFLMAAVLALVIGVKPVVPVMSVALLISHTSRVLFNLKDFSRPAFLAISIPALPCIVATALLYGRLSSSTIAFLLGAIVLVSIPLRHWAASRHIKAGKGALAGAGAVYGVLSGVSIGPGMILIPFMLGYGLTKEAFVATLAAIALMANVTRTAVFGSTALLDTHYLALGVFVGLMTVPGNWLGRSVLRRMTTGTHTLAVDVLTVLGALNFFWLALR